jgi:hypothetical protein
MIHCLTRYSAGRAAVDRDEDVLEATEAQADLAASA